MNDAPLVRGLERVGDLTREPQRVREWQRSWRKPIGQCRAGHELEDQSPDW